MTIATTFSQGWAHPRTQHISVVAQENEKDRRVREQDTRQCLDMQPLFQQLGIAA